MDKICDLEPIDYILQKIDQAKDFLSPDFLVILLGPTASGKTKLAVKLARKIDGEIISADSRQVYRSLDIGTGKDLKEYEEVPYHLIDILPPSGQYEVKQFKRDFERAYRDILSTGKRPILCGGTGSYILSLLKEQVYSAVPKDVAFQFEMEGLSKSELISRIKRMEIPEDFQIDWDSKKRLIRALEILNYLKENDVPEAKEPLVKDYIAFGLNPSLELRRSRIDGRLDSRLREGLIPEVEKLMEEGIGLEKLDWFGLEYKYAGRYLNGELDYGQFVEKLKTEIHRFAKRQMTFFRKMEKDGVEINWIAF